MYDYLKLILERTINSQNDILVRLIFKLFHSNICDDMVQLKHKIPLGTSEKCHESIAKMLYQVTLKCPPAVGNVKEAQRIVREKTYRMFLAELNWIIILFLNTYSRDV